MTASSDSVLHWRSETEFSIGAIAYECRPWRDYFSSTPARFCVRKPPELVRRLADLLDRLQPRRIVEVGVFEAGSSALIAQVAGPERLVTFDISEPHEAFERMLDAEELTGSVSSHWRIDQADGERLRTIVREELGDEPADLVIDDASHVLEPTRATFNALFPLLRPGGTYVIEDWALGHGILKPRPGETPLSALVLELVLAAAHRPDAVERVEVDGAWAMATRGPRELDEDFDVREQCGERGRSMLPPPGAGVLTGPNRAGGRGRSILARLKGSRHVG